MNTLRSPQTYVLSAFIILLYVAFLHQPEIGACITSIADEQQRQKEERILAVNQCIDEDGSPLTMRVDGSIGMEVMPGMAVGMGGSLGIAF